MKAGKLLPILLVIVLSSNAFAQTLDPPEQIACIPCEEIINIRIPDVAILQADQVQEPIPHCKVTGIIGTEINFELLLPEKWNSRFTMGGGGGFVGSVQNSAGSSFSKGYATAGTDTGHKGQGLKADWALSNMERQVNLENHEVYPGFPPGGENEPGGWQAWITGPNEGAMKLGFPSLHFGFGTEMFKYLIFQDPEWDYSEYDFSDFSKTTRYASSYLDATSTDYSEFKNQGGKMIIYHGWNDPALSAYSTINHYQQVKGNDPEVENYIRLFLLPGVLHCGGGPGPSQVDWIELVRNWVEKGIPPDRITLSKTGNETMVMTRPVYPYPSIAVYDGSGDPNRESSFIEKK